MNPINELLVIGRARGIISITEKMFLSQPEQHSGEWHARVQQQLQQQQQGRQYTDEHIAQQQAQSNG